MQRWLGRSREALVDIMLPFLGCRISLNASKRKVIRSLLFTVPSVPQRHLEQHQK